MGVSKKRGTYQSAKAKIRNFIQMIQDAEDLGLKVQTAKDPERGPKLQWCAYIGHHRIYFPIAGQGPLMGYGESEREAIAELVDLLAAYLKALRACPRGKSPEEQLRSVSKISNG